MARHLPVLFQRRDHPQDFVPFGFDIVEGLPEHGGVANGPIRKRPIKALDLAFRVAELLAQVLRLGGVHFGFIARPIEQATQQSFKTLRCEDARFEIIEDEGVENLHRDVAALAGRGAFIHPIVAGVVAIPPAFASADRHAAAACLAPNKTGKQCRSCHDAGSNARGAPRFEHVLNSMKDFRADDNGSVERDPLRLVLITATLGFRAVEIVRSRIRFARQHLVHEAGSPFAPLTPVGHALAVQVIGNEPYAASGAAQVEYLANDFRLDGVDFQFLFHRIGPDFDRDRFVPVRSG